MNDDDETVWPEYDPYPHRTAPRPNKRPGNPRVTTRFDVCELARLEQFCKRTGRDRATVVRDGVRLLLDGYPALPDDVHDWLLRLAAANDLHADPQAALELLVRHLARRRPAAGVLRY